MSEYINGREDSQMSDERFKGMFDRFKHPLVSKELALTATGLQAAVRVPEGAYVYRVGILATAAIAGGSGDIDVGDGDTADGFIDGLSALGENQIAMAGEAGTASADPHGGKYYASSDTIDVTVNATPAAGTIRVLAWYDIIDKLPS